MIAQWIGAQTIDLFPRLPERINARSVHITVGVALAVLLVASVLWRMTPMGGACRPLRPGLAGVLANGVHGCLHVLLAAMLLSGLLLVWARGDSLFNLVRVPAFAPNDREFRKLIEEIHETTGWLILSQAGLHALAALVHHYVLRDGVLARMAMRG